MIYEITEYLKDFLLKTIKNSSSVKLQVLAFTSVMFYMGRVSESTWKDMVLVLLGIRGASDVMSIMKHNKNDSKIN